MNYITIYKASLSDGFGWRVVLFVSGCDHKCPGCHNPQSWDSNYGKRFDETAKNYIYEALDKPEINGLTLSGGDPLYKTNIKELTEFCKELKEKFPRKTIWLYTGNRYEDVKDLEIMQYVNVVVDGPYIKELRDTTLKFRGSSNQRIICTSTGREVVFKGESKNDSDQNTTNGTTS